MNILYIHGWGSSFDPESRKIQTLMTLGGVNGPNLDYSMGLGSVLDQCRAMMMEVDYDVIVGTSMGGYTASHLGSSTGTPFVAINPAIDPGTSLRRYLGRGVDYVGREYHLQESVLKDMPLFNRNGYGLILLDRGDELIDSEATAVWVGDRYPIVMFEGGNHRFEHMAEGLEFVRNLVNSAEQVYGLETE